MKRVLLKKSALAIFALGLLAPTQAVFAEANSFVVNHIQFQGVSDSLLSAVKKSLPVQEGQNFSWGDSNSVIQSLYKTGYFNQISLYQVGNDLLIQAVQKPTIADITFVGNSSIKTDQLNQVLQSAGLQKGNMLDSAILAQIVQAMVDQYYTIGKYAIRVTTEVKDLPGNRVNIRVEISEGLTAKIERIDLVNAKAFSHTELVHQLSISTSGLFTFFTGTDKYSQQKMLDSLEALNKYYMDRGYINFQINSNQVALSPDKKHLYVSVSLHEGDLYHFSGYALKGDLIFKSSELEPLVHIKKGTLFSRQQVLDAAKAISDKLGDAGYAFATVNPVPVLDEKTHTVWIDFQVRPGGLYYVHRINFFGNVVTNDQVLRQQMRYVESSLYHRQKVQDSNERLTRYYGYIQDSSEKDEAVPGTTDQVNTNFTVKEQSTNQFNFSIGYSQLYQLIFGFGFNMPNVFGTGNIFGVNAQISRPYQNLTLNYTQPYFTLDGVQQTISVYVSRLNNSYTNVSAYGLNSIGTTLDYSIPINDTDFFEAGVGLDHTALRNPSNEVSQVVTDFTNVYGNSFNTYTLNTGWSRNDTNRAFFPTQGKKLSIKGTLAGPGSSLEWYKILTASSWFHPVTDLVSVGVGADVNYGHGYGKNDQLPFFQNFFGGGYGSVRGFAPGSLGQRDTIVCPDTTVCTTGPGDSVGGNLQVNGSANLYFPMPFMVDNRNVRLGWFVDAGNVYATSPIPGTWNYDYPTHPNFANMKYSTGIELEWQIPHIGPLSISFAKPLNTSSYDDTNIFQFSIGGYFDS